MNQSETKVCTKIFQTIMNNPLARLFWKYQSDVVNVHIMHPISLEYISLRLSKQKYAKVSEFVNDLHLCLSNGKNGSAPDSVRWAAAQELLMIFDSQVSMLQPLAHPSILPLQLITSDFDDDKVLPEYKFIKDEIREPGSELFSINSDPNDLVSLLRDIKLLTSSDLTIKLAVLVKNLQPEALTLGEVLSFNVGLMTEETRATVRKYVNELLHDAASGKFDPFARPFGARVEPIKIQERGMFMRASRIESIPQTVK